MLPKTGFPRSRSFSLHRSSTRPAHQLGIRLKTLHQLNIRLPFLRSRFIPSA
jgi:hypothetical protein